MEDKRKVDVSGPPHTISVEYFNKAQLGSFPRVGRFSGNVGWGEMGMTGVATWGLGFRSQWSSCDLIPRGDI
jgi:hypothetical protein